MSPRLPRIVAGLVRNSSQTRGQLRLLASLAAAGHTCGGVQALADFAKHVAINPRAVAIWTGHPSQAGFAPCCRRFGLEPGAAIGTVDLFGMPVTQVFHDPAQAHENRFAQGRMVDSGRVLQACAKLLKCFRVGPCPVVAWTSHSADADCHPGVESFAALGAVDWLDVLSTQPFDYFRIALAGPLILASHLGLMEFVAETVFFVAHAPLPEEVH
jgi:hypothetical protein